MLPNNLSKKQSQSFDHKLQVHLRNSVVFVGVLFVDHVLLGQGEVDIPRILVFREGPFRRSPPTALQIPHPAWGEGGEAATGRSGVRHDGGLVCRTIRTCDLGFNERLIFVLGWRIAGAQSWGKGARRWWGERGENGHPDSLAVLHRWSVLLKDWGYSLRIGYCAVSHLLRYCY